MMRALLVKLLEQLAEGRARARARWTGTRLVDRLLAIETAATVPVFLLSWLFSAIVFAVISGWRMARLETPAKRALLERLVNVPPERK